VTGHCGGADPTAIQLTIGPFGGTPALSTVSGSMTQVGTTKIWTVTFTPLIPRHGAAPLSFDITCPVPLPHESETANIYVDPSGTITDACTSLPISGATITLLVESPPGSGTYIPAAASTPPIIPPTNPETSLAGGIYGWMTLPGKYEVTAAVAGYVSQTTAPVTVPPAVTNLDIALNPTASCGVHTGKVTGEGKLGKGVEFEFGVKSKDGTTFKGKLDYQDEASKIDLESKTMTSLSIVSATGAASFGGSGNLEGDNAVTFQVDVTDPDATGAHDTFSIKIMDSTGATIYHNSGDLADGHIEIANDQPSDHNEEDDHGDSEHGDKSGHE
jgi:hypothetical protein